MNGGLFFEDDPLAIVLRHRDANGGRLASFLTSDGRLIDPGLRFAAGDPHIGGFSAVFRVHRGDGRPDQALKIAHRADANGPRILQEAEGARLQSLLADETGVVPTVDLIGTVEGVPAVVLDWIEGRTLAHHLEQAAVLPGAGTRIATLMLAVCRALEECEAAIRGHAGEFAAGHFVHGDLHPGNILVTELAATDDRPARVKAWLVDFSESAIGKPRGPLGVTERFASPELLRRLSDPSVAVGPPTDQFSVGRIVQLALARGGHAWHSREAALLRVAERMTREAERDRFPRWRDCIGAMEDAARSGVVRRSVLAGSAALERVVRCRRRADEAPRE